MFDRTADLYDVIYGEFKDYAAEAEVLAALLRRLRPAARSILDVACGTGEHARWLTKRWGYAVDGLDLEPTFVRIAAAKLPAATVVEADMAAFDLGRRYDVVLCLFSSIGYLRSLERVTDALRCFREHLEPGGLILVEPWFAPADMTDGHISLKTVERPNLVVSRMSHTMIDGRISRVRFEYLVGRAGGVERQSETHELGLFTESEMLACFSAAELTATVDRGGFSNRGLYVAQPAD